MEKSNRRGTRAGLRPSSGFLPVYLLHALRVFGMEVRAWKRDAREILSAHSMPRKLHVGFVRIPALLLQHDKTTRIDRIELYHLARRVFNCRGVEPRKVGLELERHVVPRTRDRTTMQNVVASFRD